jgi:hypothetical protein
VIDQRRTLIARIIFVLDVLVCGIWAYREATVMLVALSRSGSGSIAGVSGGLTVLIFTVAPPVITIVLARASGPTATAKWWRNAHLAATLALVILPMMGGLRVILVSIVVFVPVQLFFVIGALAIWFASPRKLPDAPSEASS